MPLKAGEFPPYCINHPDKKMAIVNDGNPNYFTMLLIAKEDPGPIYAATDRATAVNCYACLSCGYLEVYLVDNEIKDLRNKIDSEG